MIFRITEYLKNNLRPNKNRPEEEARTHAVTHDVPVIETHYDMLYVTHNASAEVIRAAYMALVRKYHPDRNLSNPEALAMAQMVNSAYHVLSHMEKKAEHDRWIVQQQVPEAAASAQKSDPQIEKLKAEAAAWAALQDKAEKEAVNARQRAAQAVEKAALAPAHEKSKWQSWADQAEADAKAAGAKVIEAAAVAKAATAKVGAYAARNLPNSAVNSHYSALCLTKDAPQEVIEAVYKVLMQESDKDANIRVIEEAYRVLSDPRRKSEYDDAMGKKPKVVGKANKKAEPVSSAAETRVPTQREKEAQTIADKAAAMAAAAVQMAERAEIEEKEAQAKAAKAKQDAKEKAKGADAEKWKAWVLKMDEEAVSAGKRTKKAWADVQATKEKAESAALAVKVEKERADKFAAADAEMAAKKRAVRELAEKSENGK